MMMYTTCYASPLGNLLLASDGESLTGTWFEGQKYYGAGLADGAVVQDGLPVFAAVMAWLDKYFDGKKPTIAGLPLVPEGSAFRQAVWSILKTIPCGAFMTYGDIARTLATETGREVSAQAVGGAVGHNPISVIIPCHRVVGSNGSLTGYAGGVDKKIKLLTLEGADMSAMFVPAKGTAL